MDLIYHEQQEGSLCAQHCLNSLLQGNYFSAVDLAQIAQDLDETERLRMAEGDIESAEYLQFMQQPSNNMDDSGFFSVQVINKALRVWSLDLVPYDSTIAISARQHPESEIAFICNFKEHWLTIRRLGHQWFNLNSLLTGPELISDTYLGMFLTQLKNEGYSIFVIRGSLPECNADEYLRAVPAVQTERPKLLADVRDQKFQGTSTGAHGGVSQDDLQKALEESKRLSGVSSDDPELQEAIRLSIQVAEGAKEANIGGTDSWKSEPVDVEELRRKRQAFFERQSIAAENVSSMCSSQTPPIYHSSTASYQAPLAIGEETDMTESEMLEAAIRLSMEQR